jgi:hypothetical protein
MNLNAEHQYRRSAALGPTAAHTTTRSEQLADERMTLAVSANAAEGRAGLAAFVAKRQPVFNQAQPAFATPLR